MITKNDVLQWEESWWRAWSCPTRRLDEVIEKEDMVGIKTGKEMALSAQKLHQGVSAYKDEQEHKITSRREKSERVL